MAALTEFVSRLAPKQRLDVALSLVGLVQGKIVPGVGLKKISKKIHDQLMLSAQQKGLPSLIDMNELKQVMGILTDKMPKKQLDSILALARRVSALQPAGVLASAAADLPATAQQAVKQAKKVAAGAKKLFGSGPGFNLTDAQKFIKKFPSEAKMIIDHAGDLVKTVSGSQKGSGKLGRILGSALTSLGLVSATAVGTGLALHEFMIRNPDLIVKLGLQAAEFALSGSGLRLAGAGAHGSGTAGSGLKLAGQGVALSGGQIIPRKILNVIFKIPGLVPSIVGRLEMISSSIQALKAQDDAAIRAGKPGFDQEQLLSMALSKSGIRVPASQMSSVRKLLVHLVTNPEQIGNVVLAARKITGVSRLTGLVSSKLLGAGVSLIPHEHASATAGSGAAGLFGPTGPGIAINFAGPIGGPPSLVRRARVMQSTRVLMGNPTNNFMRRSIACL